MENVNPMREFRFVVGFRGPAVLLLGRGGTGRGVGKGAGADKP